MALLEQRIPFESITVMVQKEVADRIAPDNDSDGVAAVINEIFPEEF